MNFKGKGRKNKGITLIALVVTIIVLLILAGVTIAMLSGDNSAPQKATEAAQKDAIAGAKDEIAMEVQEALLNYYNDEYVKGNVTEGASTRGEVVEAAKEAVGKAKNRNKQLLESSGVTDYTITLNTKSYTVTGTIDEKGGITWSDTVASTGGSNNKTFVDKVTIDNYGDYVDYGVDIDGNKSDNDWQIFYKDEENVYLIADDYLEEDKIPKNIKDYSDGVHVNDKISKYLTYIDDSKMVNTHYKELEYMIDTSDEIWGSLKNEKTEYVIGGPTLEMFCKSFNQKYPDKEIKYYNRDEGYDVFEYDCNCGKLDGEVDDLYCKHDVSKASVMLLASQQYNYDEYSGFYGHIYGVGSEYENNEIKFYFLSAGGSYYGDYESKDGYRPLVCLKSSVNADKEGDVWKLQ